jgi:hypothetical protein
VKGSGREHKKRYKGGPTCKKVFLNNYIFKSQMFFNGKEQRGAERSGAEQNAKRTKPGEREGKKAAGGRGMAWQSRVTLLYSG